MKSAIVRFSGVVAALVAMLVLACVAAFAAISTPLGDRAVRAKLAVAAPLAAGGTGEAELTLRPAAGWHLYGPEHGDAGAPPTIDWTVPRGIRAGAIAFPPSIHVVTHGISTHEYHGPVTLRVPLAVAAGSPASPVTLRADVTWFACAHVCVPGHGVVTAATRIVPAHAFGPGGLLAGLPFVGLAFLGGLVLNLMPCVFPVLSFKALRALEQSVDRRRRDAFAYAAGVTASCTALGVIVVATRSAALAAGWGFQLQSPVFVAILAVVVTVLAVAMTGVVEIVVPVPQGFAKRAASAGAFGDGVLVALIASACVAPYMGAALGFALTASAPLAIAVFVALGIGLALPQSVLLAVPALLRRLPKPGRWMLVTRRILALPLFATAAWLAWIFSIEVAPTVASAPAIAAAGQRPFAPATLASLRAAHRPVLVDIGAAWCITCKVNERIALDRPEFARRLEQRRVTVLYGDWTKQDATITAYLHGLGAAGVPLYVYYRADGRVDVWPQLLTPSIADGRLARG